MSITIFSILLALLLNTAESKRKQRSNPRTGNRQQFPLAESDPGEEQVLMPAPEWKSNDSCNEAIYREVIDREGCQPRYIKNRYCYGQCNSIYIPQMDSTIRHCKACAPVEVVQKEITLKCDVNNSNRWVTHFPLNVTIVKRCACQDVQCFPSEI